MFRKVFSLVLLIAVLLQVGSRWLIFLEYEWNKEYIAAELCVNKGRIPMCSGKCYLTDRLNQNQEQEQEKIPTHLKFAWETMALPAFHFLSDKNSAPYTLANQSASLSATETTWKYCINEKGIFHPPC